MYVVVEVLKVMEMIENEFYEFEGLIEIFWLKDYVYKLIFWFGNVNRVLCNGCGKIWNFIIFNDK